MFDILSYSHLIGHVRVADLKTDTLSAISYPVGAMELYTGTVEKNKSKMEGELPNYDIDDIYVKADLYTDSFIRFRNQQKPI